MNRTVVHVTGTALLVTLCVIGLAVPSVRAGHSEHGYDHSKHKTLDPAAYAAELTEKLALSEEQSVQVAEIIEEYHSNKKPVYEQIEALKEQMQPLWGQLGEMKQTKHDAIKAVLTLEQQVEYAEMGAKKYGHDKHGANCSCKFCALKKTESSESE